MKRRDFSHANRIVILSEAKELFFFIRKFVILSKAKDPLFYPYYISFAFALKAEKNSLHTSIIP